MTPAQTRIKGWRENPAQFVSDVFGATPDAWQVDAMRKLGGSYSPRRRVCLKACTGPGKSTVLAWIGWHRLLCFAEKGEHPKGIALSGEGRDNLRDNLWAELSKWQTRSPLLMRAFTWTKETIFANDHPQTWFLSARSYAKDADTEAIGRSLSGLHSRFPFVLVDEVGDMPLAVGQKAEQVFTGFTRDGLILAAGNPVSTTGLLYSICTMLRAQWEVITITADPDDPKRTPRVDPSLAREQIELYGRDNPWIMATILGLFPPSSINVLLGPDDVEKAMRRHIPEDQYDWAQKRLGIDVARFGSDRTVIFPRQGLAAFHPVTMRGARTTAIAARVIHAKTEWSSDIEFVDDTGHWGHGVIDNMITAGHSPIPVFFHGEATDPRFKNKRAEMWMKMAEWVKGGGALPNIPELVGELTAPTYSFSNGKFILEDKDLIKKRIGKSPDLGDGLALTFALPDMPKEASIKNQYNPKIKVDYDPFSEAV